MFKDDYKAAFSQVTASQETYRRVMNMPNRKKKPHSARFLGKVLVAAALISLLAVTASAAERIGIWFTQYFGGDEELSQEQVQFLEDNTQKVPPAPSKDKDPSVIHTDILQFVQEEIACQADVNNSHITGQGEPDYKTVQLRSLRLTDEWADLRYYYSEDSNFDILCSISDVTVILKDGKEITLPITDSQWSSMRFETKTPIPLENVDRVRLPDGLELKPINRVDDGYAVSLDSVLTDGPNLYFTLNLTMPENIPSPGEGWKLEGVGASTWICPAEQEKPTDEQLTMYYSTSRNIDDGDGKENTKKLVIGFTPNDNASRFNPGSQWKLHVSALQARWNNEENQRALFEGKYAGQDVLIDGEEALQVMRYEQLSYDTWDFIFTIDGEPEGEDKEVEMVTKPITMSCYRGAELSELMKDPDTERYGPYDIQLVSFRISPLSYYIEYASEEEINLNMVDPGEYVLRMKDGSEQSLFQFSGRQQFSQPVILENIEYLLLPNGQKLTMPN